MSLVYLYIYVIDDLILDKKLLFIEFFIQVFSKVINKHGSEYFKFVTSEIRILISIYYYVHDHLWDIELYM